MLDSVTDTVAGIPPSQYSHANTQGVNVMVPEALQTGPGVANDRTLVPPQLQDTDERNHFTEEPTASSSYRLSPEL